jgi:hypothetical protein
MVPGLQLKVAVAAADQRDQVLGVASRHKLASEFVRVVCET